MSSLISPSSINILTRYLNFGTCFRASSSILILIFSETLFPILLLESVMNFSGRDVFSNEEFDHNALFHAPRYLLFAHHSMFVLSFRYYESSLSSG